MPEETIFIVDDTPANLGILFDHLKSQGLKVLIDTQGETAIEAIRHTQPALILLDIRMPGTDGFEICRRLKSDETTQAIPVIFMTALTDTVDEVKGLELGAVDYITKPIHIETVLARMRTHLTLRNLQRTLEQKNAQLQKALDDIKQLEGLLPICANCKKIQDEQGKWKHIETYIENRSEASFTHGVCPECIETLYGDQAWFREMKRDGHCSI